MTEPIVKELCITAFGLGWLALIAWLLWIDSDKGDE